MLAVVGDQATGTIANSRQKHRACSRKVVIVAKGLVCVAYAIGGHDDDTIFL